MSAVTERTASSAPKAGTKQQQTHGRIQLTSPEWLPLEFNVAEGTAMLMRMSEANYRASPFLDYRVPGTQRLCSVSIRELIHQFNFAADRQ
jgi:hypothetical protein